MPARINTNLWRYNQITGYWTLARSCTKNDADNWLRVFRADEPNVHFKLGRTRPNGDPRVTAFC